MKTIIFTTALYLLITLCGFSQSMNGFNYQAVIKNNDGTPIADQEVRLKFSFLQNEMDGIAVYNESHLITTGSSGLVNLVLGTGQSDFGTFEEIIWSDGAYFLKVEVDLEGGNNFTHLGTSQLHPVPFAVYAKNVENVDDADADPANEIQDINLDGSSLSITGGSTIDISVLQDGVDDADADPENEIQDINLSGSNLSISNGSTLDLSVLQDGVVDSDADPGNEIQDITFEGTELSISNGSTVNLVSLQDGTMDDDSDPGNEIQTLVLDGDSLQLTLSNKIKLPTYESNWSNTGNDIFYNDGSVGIGTSTPTSKLVVKGDVKSKSNDLLFAVVNSSNDTVLAVFEGGVRINVDDNLGVKAKGAKAGFAVGGFSSNKGLTNEFLRISPDSVRIYVNNNPSKATGSKGGFAVGGFSSSKAPVVNFMHLTPLNYFIGHESGDSITTGEYNSFFGYQAGKNNTTGNNNSFIGYKSGMKNTSGYNNVALGPWSGLSNTTGFNNVFLGLNAGYANETGSYNVYIGQDAGRTSSNGDLNVFIGNESGQFATSSSNVFVGGSSGMQVTTGGFNTFIGASAGYQDSTGSYNTIVGSEAGRYNNGSGNVFFGTWAGDNNRGDENLFLGFISGNMNINGSNNTFLGNYTGSESVGDGNVFIGYRAGVYETGSNILHIATNDASSLIYGEFDNKKVAVNGSLNYGSTVGTDSYTTDMNGIDNYHEGLSLYLKFVNTNTGAATIDLNSLGAKSIVKIDGSALSGGELIGGGIHLIIYDGTNFQLMTFM